ncbi:MAG: HDOD domain-containing protein [Desulfonauticus sp.]|nr:HDOD domain-containing protein [Desulfonauticus sp.]
MDKIALKDLKPGMQLATDVKAEDGQIILPKGLTLTENHIQELKKIGIASVYIDKGKQNTKIKISATDLDKLKQYLSPLFASNDFGEPLVRNIFYLSLAHLAQKYLNGWKIPDKRQHLPVEDGSFKDAFYKDEINFSLLVQKEVELVSFPDIYFKIVEAIKDPNKSAADIAKIVSKDPSLSAKLLKLVNSPFYGLSQKVETISRAITIIGANELSTLALGIAAVNVFKDIPEQLIDMKSFWLHSIAVGVFAKLLAQRSHLEQEKYFVAGLLHDIGRLVLFKHIPRLATEALLFSYANLIPLVEAEREVIGFDHALVGNSLIQAWNLPESLGQTIKLHHFPGKFVQLSDAIVHLADFLAIAMHISPKGSIVVPQLNKSIPKLINLSKEELKVLVNKALLEIEDTIRVFV